MGRTETSPVSPRALTAWRRVSGVGRGNQLHEDGRGAGVFFHGEADGGDGDDLGVGILKVGVVGVAGHILNGGEDNKSVFGGALDGFIGVVDGGEEGLNGAGVPFPAEGVGGVGAGEPVTVLEGVDERRDGAGILDGAEGGDSGAADILVGILGGLGQRIDGVGAAGELEDADGAAADGRVGVLQALEDDVVIGSAGEDVGVDGGGEIGALHVEIERDLRAFHLEDFGIGLDLFGEVVDAGLVGGSGVAGADLRFAGLEGVDEDVVGVGVLLLISEGLGALEGFTGLAISAAREREGENDQHRAATETTLHVRVH